MEPDAGVEMIDDAITKYNGIYSTIICDDNSTIRAVTKWSYKESMVWLSMAKDIKW